MKCTVNQKKTLELLIDKYERSKTYNETNRVKQTIAVTPAKIWKEYTSDYTRIELIHDFESEMISLQNNGLINIARQNGEIKKIALDMNGIDQCYLLLNRREKKASQQQECDFFEEWLKKKISIVDDLCKEQIERINSGKKSKYSMEEANDIFRTLEFILNNKSEILERELSILLYSDSKVFQKIYRSKVCNLLLSYGDFEEILLGIDNQREKEKAILEEFGVYTNPSYVHIKGDADIKFKNGDSLRINNFPLALSSQLISIIENFKINSSRIVTVENLTSFHRIDEEDTTYIYIAGYHNRIKQSLLNSMHAMNSGKEWFHFGDIDPDGFYILENLIKKTGISFKPMMMDTEELKKYSKYCKFLEVNDIIKAKNLINMGKYSDVLEYMLKHNCKLEQEVISFNRGM